MSTFYGEIMHMLESECKQITYPFFFFFGITMIAYPLKTKSSTQQYINPQNMAKNCTKKTQTLMSTAHNLSSSLVHSWIQQVGLELRFGVL